MEAIYDSFSEPLLKPLVTHLVNNGINTRKSFIALSRYQGLPSDPTSTLYDRTILDIEYALGLIRQLQHCGIIATNDDPWTYLDYKLSSTTFSGMLLYSLCIHPYPSSDIEEQIYAQFRAKEKDVLDSRQPYSRMNFNVWGGDIHGQLHPSIPSNPRMADFIGKAIHDTFRRFSGTTLFPRYSNKPLTSRDILTLKRKFPEIRPDEDLKYPVDLDELYGSKRIRLDNPVEMRQRWYPSQLVPRTYFVSSSTAHNHSRYLQAFFNSLCDSMPMTNRISRVNPSRLFMKENSEFLFYDLTTFTSRCIAVRDFIRWLASQGKAYPVNTHSIGEGTHSTTIGDLLEDYAETVNEFLPWCNDDLGWEGDHGVAGYLGVYGNIASCTFIHGATLGMMCETEHDSGCAGDDAAINTTNAPGVEKGISTIGIYESSKVYAIKSRRPTPNSDALYLKRRTFLSERGNLQQLELFRPPSYLYFVRNDPQYARFKVELFGSNKEVRRRCLSSIMSSFRSAVFLEQSDLAMAQGILRNFYRSHQIPTSGFVPQFSKYDKQDQPFIPNLEHFGNPNFMEKTIESCYSGYARVPNREPIEDGVYLRLRSGMIFESTERPQDLVVLEKLRIIRRVSYPGGFLEYYGENALFAVLREYTASRSRYCRRKYRYEVVKPIPNWAWNREIVEFYGRFVGDSVNHSTCYDSGSERDDEDFAFEQDHDLDMP